MLRNFSNITAESNSEIIFENLYSPYNISQSYERISSGTFLWLTVYITTFYIPAVIPQRTAQFLRCYCDIRPYPHRKTAMFIPYPRGITVKLVPVPAVFPRLPRYSRNPHPCVNLYY